MADLGFLKQGHPSEAAYPEAADQRIPLEFGQWEFGDAANDEDLGALKTVHLLATKTWHDAIETIGSVSADDDPTLNNDGRLKIVAGIIAKKAESVARIAEREFARVTAILDETEREIDKAMRTADAVTLSVQDGIRQHFKALGGGSKTLAALATAIQDRDTVTLQALLVAPAYISGIPKDNPGAAQLLGQARQVLAEAMAPALVKRATALRGAQAATDHALRTLDRKLNATLDFKKARALSERAKDHTRNHE